MRKGKSALVVFCLVLFLAIGVAAYTSENYSIPNIAVIPVDQGASENYRLYDIAEEPIGSGKGTSADYNLWTGFPATVGIPRVPGSLSVAVDSNTQNTVLWDSNGNPPGVAYQLQEVTPVSQSLYSGTSTGYEHSSLTPGQQYCYKARALLGVYTAYTAQVCASALPGELTVTSSHAQNAFSTDATVDFNASADANHFYYTWDQLADTQVTAGGTWWSGSQIEKTATSDGNWYLHARSANQDNNLNSGGTMHYGPYNIDSNEPYTYDDANSEWQTTNVSATLVAVDNASGVANTYYCIDTENSCTPTTEGTSPDITCSDTCQKYLRYYSADSAGNSETARSRLIKIDKQPPPMSSFSDEGTTSSDLVLTFTYDTDDNSGSGIGDFWLELRTGSTSGDLAYEGWTGDSDGSYDYLGALEAYTYYARGKVKDSVGQESSFSGWTDGVYVNSTSHPASTNYAMDMYTIIPSGQVDSDTYSIYDLVVGQPAVSMGSDNYTAETGFAGGFMENSAPTISYNSPNTGYYGSETVSIDFNIIEAESDIAYIDLAYSTTAGVFQNLLLDDVNLTAFADVSGLNCDDNDFTATTNCIYSWDTSGVQDNNYFIDFNTWDSAGASNSGSSTGPIRIDKAAPATTDNAGSDTYYSNPTITLSPSDTGSGIALTKYCIDTTNTCDPVDQGTSVPVTCPAGTLCSSKFVRYYSIDNAGNQEETKSSGTITVDRRASWFDQGWLYRKKLSFNNSSHNLDLENFPALVVLTTANFTYSNAQPDGDDLRFTDPDGTLLSYEIEKWNADGNSYIWVRVPKIDASSAEDHVYLYYGNSSASSGQNINGTWHSSYKMVQHLQETSASTDDSTSNANYCTVYGASPFALGKIDGAFQFDGSDDHISTYDSTSLDFAGDITLEAWVKTSNTAKQMVIAEKFNPDEDRGYGLMVSYEGKPRFYGRTGTSAYQYVAGASSIADGSWHHVAGIRAGSTWKVLVDGSLAASASNSDASFANSLGLFIGRTSYGQLNHFDGYIDELRLSDTARSAGWINATQLSGKNSFITHYSQETQ